MHVVAGLDKEVAAWVASKLPNAPDWDGPFVALGWCGEDLQPLAGVVFFGWQPDYGRVEIAGAIESPRACTPRMVRELFRYPFQQLKARKVFAQTQHGNARCLRFLKGLGFTQEAVLANHFGDQHAVVLRMLEKDYRKKYPHENESPLSA